MVPAVFIFYQEEERLKKLSIAIDGPASAGKSTIAKKVAKKLDFIYLDTGAMYRSLTFAAMRAGVLLDNEDKLVELLSGLDVSFVTKDGLQHILLNGEDVTEQIRQQDVTQQVSLVSSHQKVREELVRRQQEFAKQGGIVMDGRDIGTVVMPDAPLKIFLVASAEERARRRYEESIAKGMDVSLKQLTEDLIARDHYDMNRSVSPLKKAEDAIEIDSTFMSIDEVVNKVLKLSEETIR